jgi:HEPN domain-containing protein
MDRNEKVAYWIDIAEYDLETARSMLASGRYLYAAFMSQQALEKSLKAIVLAHGGEAEPPRTHNLTFLLGAIGRQDTPSAVSALAARLSAYYIEARYPNYKEKLSQLVDEDEAKEIVRETEEAFSWLRSLIT